MASRAYINNLSLVLEEIRHNPNNHRSSMAILLLLHKRLCQLVNNIVNCLHSAYLHISSIYYLSLDVISPRYVFRLLVRSRLLSMCDGTIVIIMDIKGSTMLRTMQISLINFLIKINSFVANKTSIYSNSVVESSIVSYFELF